MHNVGIVGAALALTLAINQLAMILVARILVPEDFGVYAGSLVFISLVSLVSTFGLDSAMIHRKSNTEQAFRTATALRLIFALVASASAFIASPWISDLMNLPNLTNALRVSSLSMIIYAVGFESSTRLSRNLSFAKLSATKITYSAAWSAAALLLAYLGWNYWALIFAYMIGTTAMVAALSLLQPWNIPRRTDKGTARELLAYGSFPLMTGLIGFLVANLDKVVVGHFADDSSTLGTYWIAYSWGTIIPTMFSGIVTSVLFPILARMQYNMNEIRNRYLLSLKYLGYISIPLGVGLAAISDTFVGVLLGPTWSDAVIPLAFCSIGGTLICLTGPAGSVFLATGNPNRMFRASSVFALPYFAMLVPAMIFGQQIGVALVFLIYAAITFAVVLVMIAGTIHSCIKEETETLYRATLASIASAIVCIWIRSFMNISVFTLLTQVTVAAAVFVTLMILLTKMEIIAEVKSILRAASWKG